MAMLPAREIDTTGTPDAAVIWLHGLGADGNDFVPLVPELHLPAGLGVRFVFPHAPKIAVTINGGFVMPAWYDIFDPQIDRRLDLVQLMASAAAVTALVDREIDRGIASRRIVVAGFSQGGAVAYQVALGYGRRLAGLLAMSTYIATADTIRPAAENKKIPIEVHHGVRDPVVPEGLGRRAAETLKKLGYAATYRSYPMEHGICPPQIRDISAWLQKVLAG